ncbi:MAG: tetratricopeptide repeat-containing sensor histidine kinase [Bacteroidales bacterium]|nr:tetratricopeptide repeat-containing sensor histidine kinase [Bacteroidales bacterium]MCF8404203.1 tetratricopeptide repeat-containing sensor histidine kinase [Bacteroidales bacterium]
MKGCLILGVLLTMSIIAYTKPNASNDILYAQLDSLEKIVYNHTGSNQVSEALINNCSSLAALYTQLEYPKQIEYGKRLLMVVNNLDKEYLQIKILEMIAEALFQIDDFNNSIEYYYRLYNVYSLSNDEINSAKTLLRIGSNYYFLCKYIKAKDYYERALLIFKKNQQFIGISEALKGIALILGHWGEYDKALSHNQEALSFCKEMGDDASIAAIHFNIGTIYQELGDFTSARDNLLQSLEIYQELNDLTAIVTTTCHIGEIYLTNKLHDQALEYYLKAEMISKKMDGIKLHAEVSYSIGKAYNLKGDYMKALDYQRKALRLYQDSDNKKSLVETYAELGHIYYNLEHYDKALYYLDMGYKIAESINYKYLLTIYHKQLADVNAKLGNYQEAYSFFLQHIEGRDQIYQEERKLKTEELQTKYYVTVKEKEVDELMHTQQLNKALIKNQKLIMLFIIFILFGSLVLSIVFRIRYLQNQKLNVQLSIQNKEIEDQQYEVEKLNTNLQKANASKDKFFSIIAHDLKNPFNSLLGLSDLLLEDYENLNEEERKEFITQIKTSGDKIYSLLQNLLIWGRNQLGKIVVSKEVVCMDKLVDETVQITKQHASGKNITIKTNIPEEICVYADKNMISTVILNLITNAIKFTPPYGEIEIHCFDKEDYVEIMVADTGMGISKINQEKLFRVDEKFQTDGTNKEKGTGLGLILCKDFIEKNSGKIWVESDEGAGSWFCFTLPKPA